MILLEFAEARFRAATEAFIRNPCGENWARMRRMMWVYQAVQNAASQRDINDEGLTRIDALEEKMWDAVLIAFKGDTVAE